MTKKIVSLAFAVLVVVLVVFVSASFAADDPATPTDTVTEAPDATAPDGEVAGEEQAEAEPEVPSFNNPTQAARAANLAAAAAAQPNEALEGALTEVQDAEAALAAAEEAQDETAIAAAQAALDAAKEKADTAMAESTSVTEADIAGMRDAGMGWGEIAHELGLHPSVLGMGLTKRAQTAAKTSAKAAGTAKAQTKAKVNARVDAQTKAKGVYGANISGNSRNTKTGSSEPGGVKGASGNGKSVGLGQSKSGSRSASSGNSGSAGKGGGKSGGKGGGSNGKGGGNGGGNGGGKK